jgi:hypothetical protein
MIVRMWEVLANPDSLAELMNWLCEVVLPSAEVNPLHVSSEVLSSTDNRLVVISKWRSSPMRFADPPRHLVARDPHVWDFAPVDR